MALAARLLAPLTSLVDSAIGIISLRCLSPLYTPVLCSIALEISIIPICQFFFPIQPLKSLELTSTIDSADNLTQRKISHQQFEEKKVVIDQQCTSHPIFVPNSCQEIKYFFYVRALS